MNKRGFTLIELLVVIAIVGILAGIVMVTTSTSGAKSRDARRQADVKNIESALAVYYQLNKQYPNCNGFANDLAGHTASMSCLSTALVGAGLYAKVPQDPQFPGKSYVYNNWCNVPNGISTSRYRLHASTETDMDGLLGNWWSDFYVGATPCQDPS